jgi:hypothetical protein
MTEKEIKRKLEDDGLKVVDVARALSKQFPQVGERSAETMLRELIAGRRWFPVYAEWLKRKYGVEVNRPSWLKPVRERMRQAA